jgi:ABC-type transporter MlaC component
MRISQARPVMKTAVQCRYFKSGRAFAFLVIGASLVFISPRAHAADPAGSFVQNQIEVGHQILGDPTLTADVRHQKFRDFILSMTDMKRVALFTVGSYLPGANEADVSRFVAAFTEFSVGFYERAWEAYRGQAIRLTGSTRRSNDDAVVTVAIANPSTTAPPLKAAFRVRKTEDGKSIVTDIRIEGVWLVLSQRAEFAVFLQEHHGNISQLAQGLETRTAYRRHYS